MSNDLSRLQILVDELRTTNSSNKKKEILKKYDEPIIKNLLIYTFDPFRKYHVTSKNLKKLKNLDGDYIEFINLTDMLDNLMNRYITGHNAIRSVNNFINKNSEYSELIHNIIDKDLRCRVGSKLINQVWPKLIPQFQVALAEEYKDYYHKVDFENEEWYASRKLDGLRCITIKNGLNVRFFSREGKEFYTLGNLINPILELPFDDIILDGELCIIDEDGNENFKLISKEYNKKNHTIENPCLVIFDCLHFDEFDNEKSDVILTERIERISSVLHQSDKLKVLSQYRINNINEFEEFKELSITSGWEGMMLRKNIGYEGKRSKYLLKEKPFFEEEFMVEDVEIGPIRHIVEDENGKTFEAESEMMTKVIIKYKGYNVRVGSGFSINDRLYYKDYPNEIIGKIITVRYLSESYNDQGGLSLRHGTIKSIHGYKREV